MVGDGDGFEGRRGREGQGLGGHEESGRIGGGGEFATV